MADTPPQHESPFHPILDQPYTYRITRLDYACDPHAMDASWLDLTLARGTEQRRLRFLRPQNLKIEAGFPQPTGGLVILDIRHHQWEGLRVQVADFENAQGAITFFAADVIDRDIP